MLAAPHGILVGVTLCQVIKGGGTMEIVAELVQPAPLETVTVYMPAPKFENVVGLPNWVINPGCNKNEIGPYTTLPLTVMLAFALPAQIIAVAVNDKLGVGSTKIVIVESRKGQPGKVAVTV